MTDIEELKSRLDIVEVVQSYVPGLKRAGRSYKANCPFHQENTPSFVVTPEIQRYKCFGCGEGGDVLNFIQQIERVEFGEALAIAADKAGYELKGNVHKDKTLETEKENIYKANALAAKFWHYLLKTHPSGKPGRELMQARNIRIEEVDKFQLGYAPNGNNMVKFLTSKGYKPADLLKWGLATEKQGQVADKFRNRFMMPIMDMKGNILGFSGRIIGKSDYAPKYLNSPETQAYKKGDILIGLYQAKEEARKQKFLILVEGNIDPLSSNRLGIANIAATGGTALTEQQCKLIKRYADSVYFAFDSDSAGIKALVRGIELAERIGLKHRVLDIKDYQDPDELINKAPEIWSEVINSPVNSIEHLVQVFQNGLDLGSADGKSEFFARILPVLKSIQDQIQLDHFIERTALLIGATKDVVREAMQGEARPAAAGGRPGPADLSNPSSSTPQSQQLAPSDQPTTPLTTTNPKELYLLALLLNLNNPETTNNIDPEIFTDVNISELFRKLSLANQPVNILSFAEDLSDGGMEALQEAMAINMPQQDVMEEIAQVSKQIRTVNLKARILSLREKLKSTPDNLEVLEELNKLTKELSSLERPGN